MDLRAFFLYFDKMFLLHFARNMYNKGGWRDSYKVGMLSPVTMDTGGEAGMTAEMFYTLSVVFSVLGLLIAVATLCKKK